MSNIEKLKESARKAKEKADQAKKRLLLAEQREKLKLSAEERKRDTRKKVLLGAWTMTQLSEEKIKAHMNKYLTRADERALFDLPPLSHADTPAAVKE